MTREDIQRRYVETAPLEELREQLSTQRLARIEAAIAQRQRGLMILMENVWNPHNMAAITRSADAFGVQTIHYTSENALDMSRDTTPDITMTASNANKWVDHNYRGQAIVPAIQALQAQDWKIAAAVVSPDAKPLHDIDWPSYDKLVLLVGNEHRGISKEAEALADIRFYIHMRGLTESFNVSVAASLSLYEIIRQRDQSGKDFSLSQEQAEALTEQFIRNAIY